ncbi:hypothetical protein, partial [Stenotrophomonas maltophilia]|uniref:hypothetical protein n=1 Tax=Stenotrophomonas maltophilia TaxID=40324 RepID=UPI0039C2108B
QTMRRALFLLALGLLNLTLFPADILRPDWWGGSRVTCGCASHWARWPPWPGITGGCAACCAG